MNSSIALLALWGALVPQVNRLSLNWEQDYRQARATGVRVQKPLAVFVGTGADGWKQLLREGNLDAELRKTLVDRYVPVYINQDTDDGKQMAELFGLSGKHGLIISDRSGGAMAFRHDGDLTAKDLARHLTRFSDPDHVVTTTEYGGGAPAPAPAPTSAGVIYQNPFACQT